MYGAGKAERWESYFRITERAVYALEMGKPTMTREEIEQRIQTAIELAEGRIDTEGASNATFWGQCADEALALQQRYLNN